ncbi:hypothetical protein GM676_18845, partial [Duganella radicis]|nr:hypothetical protein [Duganella radicis]
MTNTRARTSLLGAAAAAAAEAVNEALAAAQAEMPDAGDPAAMRRDQVFLSRQMIGPPPATNAM